MNRVKASFLVEALSRFHEGAEWACFRELRLGTGIMECEKRNVAGRIDFWAMNLHPSKDHLRVAYEVKVSRADFQYEIRHPDKRRGAILFSNHFYFCVPNGLVESREVPDEAGLIYVNADGQVQIKKRAPFREAETPDLRFVAAILRRKSYEEVDHFKQERDRLQKMLDLRVVEDTRLRKDLEELVDELYNLETAEICRGIYQAMDRIFPSWKHSEAPPKP